MPDALRLFTIYKHPKDFPRSYVVRGFSNDKPDPLPLAVGPTLEAVRQAIPPGMVMLHRSNNDDPVIVETWI